ncbi:MAG TPA: polysaccharide deacetylase family protein [Puia sp.]|nr:polysaccharide deacetylase family protein [Puia sp.]
MKIGCFLLTAGIFISSQIFAQQTIQERLGYPKDTKLLIIHADDVGVSHSENMATLAAMDKGVVSCGSMMVPCPWFPEIAAYASSHHNIDLGIHLTLTSEWKNYRWGPVSGTTQSPSLANKRGFLYDDVDSLGKMAQLKDVERELRAQIERSIQFGVYPSHLDSHMGSCFFRKDYFLIYLQLSREYHIPCLLNRDAFRLIYGINLDELLKPQDVVVDRIFMAFPQDYSKGMPNYYAQVISSLKPGLSCILLHAAYNNEEMQAVTVDHPDYGAAWRQADFDFFTSDACKKLLDENHVHVISWREIKEKLFDKK